jgi:predicted nicotinamide N-methyase
MVYPIKLADVFEGLHLYVPVPELVKPTYDQLLAVDKSIRFPFWAKIWPSSIAMTSFLQSDPDLIQSKKVLELGAGIGLPSFFIAASCSEMIISDYDADAVELIEMNIKSLGLNHVKAMCLDWNNFPEDLKADTLLLSDINYVPEQFEPLLKLIHQFVSNGATVVVATPERITATPFATLLQPLVTRSVVRTIQQIDIRMLVLEKNG